MKEQLQPINQQVTRASESGRAKLLWKVVERVPFYAPLLLLAATVACNAQSVEQDPTPNPTTITTVEPMQIPDLGENNVPFIQMFDKDTNRDGVTNICDARLQREQDLPPILVDINGEKNPDTGLFEITQRDVDILESEVGSRLSDPGKDLNCDGEVSQTDLEILRKYLPSTFTNDENPNARLEDLWAGWDPKKIEIEFDANISALNIRRIVFEKGFTIITTGFNEKKGLKTAIVDIPDETFANQDLTDVMRDVADEDGVANVQRFGNAR